MFRGIQGTNQIDLICFCSYGVCWANRACGTIRMVHAIDDKCRNIAQPMMFCAGLFSFQHENFIDFTTDINIWIKITQKAI